MYISRRTLMLGVSTLPVIAAVAPSALAGTSPVYSERGFALNGTDPVAYFEQSKPVAGSENFTHHWNGATWLFSTIGNRKLFAAAPEKYAPRYGGYCAYAVSEGYTASSVPQAWEIVDDKLYLNFSLRIQQKWQKDIPGRIAAADLNWPRILA